LDRFGLFNQPFQPSTQRKVTAQWKNVNAAFQFIRVFPRVKND